MAASKIISYEEHVIVAETDWKFDYGMPTGNSRKASGPPRIVKNSLRMDTVEWNIAFTDEQLAFRCRTMAESLDEMHVHMELVIYRRHQPADPSKERYTKRGEMRHIFTRSTNVLRFNITPCAYLFTIRILKPRSVLPDFTVENTIAGRWASNGKLRVGAQLFHVNKQLLSMHTDFFELMFNNPAYMEANQEVVELKHVEHADPAVFHDFLLVMCVAEALPNPKNLLAALFHLANIYQVQNVRDKCQLHLTMCREMAVEERYVLALESKNEKLQTILRNSASREESERIIAAVSKKAVSF